MSTLFGCFSPRDRGTTPLADMARAGGTDFLRCAVREVPSFVVATTGSSPPARLVETDDFLLAIVGRPRISGRSAGQPHDLALARLLKERGVGALESICGEFALAGWDRIERRGMLAVDRIGVRSLVYRIAESELVFASTLDYLKVAGQTATVSSQAIFDYLYFHVVPGDETIYREFRRLPPGHFLEFRTGRAEEVRPYWTPRFVEDRDEPLGALKEEFRTILHAAVASAANGVSDGAFLSGGTDSSTVSGMLGRVSGAPTQTFSIGFDAAGYDEMEYARIAARHFGCKAHEYYVTPADVVDAVPRIASWYDQPFGNASAVPAYYCARLARDNGVAHLLAGDGGDELFGGNERYAKQRVFALYHRMPQKLRRAVIEPLLLSAPAAFAPGLKKLHSYVKQASPEMPWRYDTYNLLTHLGAETVLTREFLAEVDVRHPQEVLRNAHAPHANASLINQMLGIDLRLVLADGDLPKVTRMCELAGVDVAFPLLDARLFDFSAKLAPSLKLRGTQLRWFFKEALRDFLPPAVISKQKHGFGLPVGAWLASNKRLFELAAESIRSPRLRGIVRSPFVDELLGARLREHPKYYGTMAWVLMMLGLWLESRRA